MRRYRSNQKTDAFKEYVRSTKQVDYILRLESKLTDPPIRRDVSKLIALRSAAAILMVSIFEYYLKSAFSEIADRINEVHNREKSSVPPGIYERNVQAYINYIKNFRGQKSEKIAKVKLASKYVVDLSLFPEAFGDTRASPKPDTIKEMFEAIGAGNVWPTIV